MLGIVLVGYCLQDESLFVPEMPDCMMSEFGT